MTKRMNLTNQRFGRLLVSYETQSKRSPSGALKRYFLCVCDCGNERIIELSTLRSGHTKSCGCLHKEQLATRARKHGHAVGNRRSATHAAWTNMIQRCTNPKRRDYSRYGGRGITVCDRWLHSFENFLEDMGEKPKATSLDRYPDTNGNYEPGNCRWATAREQSNNKRNNVKIWFAGTYYTMPQLCRTLNLSYEKFRKLYRAKKLSMEQILLRDLAA